MAKTNQNVRGAMHHGNTVYGGTHIAYMSGDECGYATDSGEVMLRSIHLTKEAVELIQQGKAIRVLSDGQVEPIEGETAGLIVFGNFKGDRPRLGK